MLHETPKPVPFPAPCLSISRLQHLRALPVRHPLDLNLCSPLSSISRPVPRKRKTSLTMQELWIRRRRVKCRNPSLSRLSASPSRASPRSPVRSLLDPNLCSSASPVLRLLCSILTRRKRNTS